MKKKNIDIIYYSDRDDILKGMNLDRNNYIFFDYIITLLETEMYKGLKEGKVVSVPYTCKMVKNFKKMNSEARAKLTEDKIYSQFYKKNVRNIDNYFKQFAVIYGNYFGVNIYNLYSYGVTNFEFEKEE